MLEPCCYEGCPRCLGEYCDVHFNSPCACDVVARHTDAAGRWTEGQRDETHYHRGTMTTKLDKTLTREVSINGQAHTLTLTPTGFRLTAKRQRRALVDRTWAQIAQLADTDPLPDSAE